MTTPTGPAWLPSRDRTIPLFAYGAMPPRGRLATPLPRRWPDKAPGSGLDYTIDCTAWAAETGDSIASAAATDSADLTVVAVVVVAGRVVVWVANGSPGDHTVTVAITTASGQVVNAPVTLRVDPALPAITVTPLGLTTEAGAQLTAEDGTPLLIDAGALGASITLRNGETITTESGVPLF